MFKAALESILERTEGSLGALIMGVDGIHVERVLSAEGQAANLDVAATEITSLIRSARRTGSDVELGEPQEMILIYPRAALVVRMLGADYFLLLAVAPDGNLGRGRFEARKAELDFAKEFAV